MKKGKFNQLAALEGLLCASCFWIFKKVIPIQVDALNFVEKAKTRLNLLDGKVKFISIRREKPSSDSKNFQTLWSVNIKSDVKEGSVDYDNNGGEISVSE